VITRSAVFMAMVLFIANQAWATSWVFQCPADASCPSTNGSGNMLASEVRFDDGTLDFSWSATYSPNSSGFTPDAFFIVVSNGPEPTSNRQAAILYGDGANDFVTAYSYDLSLKRNSWQTAGNFIGRFSNPDLFTPSGGNVLQNLALSGQTSISLTTPLVTRPGSAWISAPASGSGLVRGTTAHSRMMRRLERSSTSAAATGRPPGTATIG